MGKILKYEIHRTQGMFLTVACVSLAAEALYLIGWFFHLDLVYETSIFVGILCIFLGSLLVAVRNISQLNEDIGRKQGYMIFSIPRSSVQILLAKWLSALITFAALTIVFMACIAFDVFLHKLRYNWQFSEILPWMYGGYGLSDSQIIAAIVTPHNIFGACMHLVSYIVMFMFMIVVAYMAMLLTRSLLGNHRGVMALSIVLWIVLQYAMQMLVEWIQELITPPGGSGDIYPDMQALVTEIFADMFGPASYLPTLIVYLVGAVLAFFAANWLMKKKLSL